MRLCFLPMGFLAMLSLELQAQSLEWKDRTQQECGEKIEIPGLNEKVQEKVVLVSTPRGASGSGFIAKQEGKTWFFTNEHIVRMDSNLKCVTVGGFDVSLTKDSVIEVAKNRDLVRVEVSANIPALEWFDGIPKINDPIGVYGNSDGGGVSTEIFGMVLGIGFDRVEVSANFVPGNSGGPIVNKEGQIVGVATYATINRSRHWTIQGTDYDNRVRHFGIRLNGCEWESTTLGKYVSYAKGLDVMEEFKEMTCNAKMIFTDVNVKHFARTSLPRELKKKLMELVDADKMYSARLNWNLSLGGSSETLANSLVSLNRNLLRYEVIELMIKRLQVENWPVEKLKKESEELEASCEAFLKDNEVQRREMQNRVEAERARAKEQARKERLKRKSRQIDPSMKKFKGPSPWKSLRGL